MLFSTASQFVVLGLMFFIGLIFAFVIHPGGRKWKDAYQEEIEQNASYRNDADNEIRLSKRRIAELERENAALEQKIIATPEAPRAPWPPLSAVETAPVAAVPVVAAPVEPTPVVPVAAPVPLPVVEDAHFEPVAEPAPAPVIAAAPVVVPFPVAHEPPAAVIEPNPVVETAPVIAPAPHLVTEPAADMPAPVPMGAALPVPDEAKRAWLGAAGYNDLMQIRGVDSVLNTRLFGLGVTRYADLEKLSAEDEMALEQRLNVPAGFIAREQWREQAALLRAGNVTEHAQRFGAVQAPA